MDHEIGTYRLLSPVKLGRQQGGVVLILAMIATREIAKHDRIMAGAEGINRLGQFLAKRLVGTDKNADFPLGGQGWKFIMWHDAAYHSCRRQFTQ